MDTIRASIVVFLVVLLLPTLVLAQAGTGQIQGVCRDPEKAAVPGATVTIRDLETGMERVLKTDDAGRFAAPFMPAGTYSVVPESAGLAPARRTEAELTVGAILELTLEMVPAAVQQQVSVVTEAPPLLTSQTEVSSTLNAIAIQNLAGFQRQAMGKLRPIDSRRYERWDVRTCELSRCCRCVQQHAD